MSDPVRPAAFGGPGQVARPGGLRDELGGLWAACGLDSEWAPLEAVLLHRPGPELSVSDPDRALQLAPVDWRRAQAQHDALAAAYLQAGVAVTRVDPPLDPPPNQVFSADLFWMTPEGAVLGRPATAARAGEERWVARRLAELGVPILLSIHGHGTFEGADALWLGPDRVMLGVGPRTNRLGADQVAGLLTELGVTVERVPVPVDAMHLMGLLRFLDGRRAIAWPGRLPPEAAAALGRAGFELLWAPAAGELTGSLALNFVTLGPGRVLMPAGCPRTQAYLEDAQVACQFVEMDELARAAGGIACMTGVLRRSLVSGPSAG